MSESPEPMYSYNTMYFLGCMPRIRIEHRPDSVGNKGIRKITIRMSNEDANQILTDICIRLQSEYPRLTIYVCKDQEANLKLISGIINSDIYVEVYNVNDVKFKRLSCFNSPVYVTNNVRLLLQPIICFNQDKTRLTLLKLAGTVIIEDDILTMIDNYKLST